MSVMWDGKKSVEPHDAPRHERLQEMGRGGVEDVDAHPRHRAPLPIKS